MSPSPSSSLLARLAAWWPSRRAPSREERALLQEQQRLIVQLRAFLDGEVAETRGEIERSTTLLRDAIDKLNASFKDMEGQTRRQAATIWSLVERGVTGGNRVGSPGVRQFAEAAGRLIGDLAQVVTEGARESVLNVQAMDETAQRLDEIFALVAGQGGGEAGERIRELVQASKASVARVRRRVEDTAEREMGASVDAKLRADELIAQVNALNRALGDGMEIVAGCMDHIRESVATAVRSLQFEDITTQSLGAANTHLERLAAMNEEATPLEKVLPEGEAAAPTDARLRSLEQFGRYLQQLRDGEVRPARRSVSQVDMRSGAVDLF